jgi:hypothetical protein
MPYLNLDFDYFDHPKTVRLVGLLGRGSEVLPLRLWIYCGRYHYENGRLAGYSEQEIETHAKWWGKAGTMLPAMKTARYMAHDAQGWFMCNWLEHQGHIAALKQKGRDMAEARWSKLRMHTACTQHADSNAPSVPANQPTNQPPDQEARGDVELPDGFPKTEKAAIAGAMAVACSDEFKVKTWELAVSRGGMDSRGNPIRKWAAYVSIQWKYEQERIAKDKNRPQLNGGKPYQKSGRDKEIERLLKM